MKFQKKKKIVILTFVGRGAKYSGVMYLSPTLEIIVSRSLMLLPDSSRIVMGSRMYDCENNNRKAQITIKYLSLCNLICFDGESKMNSQCQISSQVTHGSNWYFRFYFNSGDGSDSAKRQHVFVLTLLSMKIDWICAFVVQLLASKHEG